MKLGWRKRDLIEQIITTCSPLTQLLCPGHFSFWPAKLERLCHVYREPACAIREGQKESDIETLKEYTLGK